MATVNKEGLANNIVRQGKYEDINKLCAINSIVEYTKKMFPEFLDRKEKLRYVGLENETFNLTKALDEHFKLDVLSYEFDKTVYERALKVKPKFARVELKNILKHEYTGEQLIWFDSVNGLTNNFANSVVGIVKRAEFKDKVAFVVTYVRHGINNYFTLGATYSPYKEFRFVEVIAEAIESEFVTVKNAKISVYANIQGRTGKGTPKEMVQVIFEVVKK